MDDTSGQGAVVAFLSASPAFGGAGPVERHETHGAYVFLAGDTALKIKRAVRFSYMDFSTIELRRQALARELELNAPHAPGIYQGLVPITREADGSLAVGGTGDPVEWALRMRRFAQDQLLSSYAERGALDPLLCRQLADAVFAAHAKARPSRTTDHAGEMRAIAVEVADALEATGEPALRELAARLHPLLLQRVAAGQPLLQARAAGASVRRCHGDLHLGNIVVWQGRPVLFDALEFDERLATIDVLYDLAFLLMDLDHRGQRAAANVVLNRYLWRTGRLEDLDALALLPLFMASRAAIRAMVSAQRVAGAGKVGGQEGLRTSIGYLDSALAHLAPPPAQLVAIGGLSGTGKSTLGAALAPRIGQAPGALHLRSDLERKALFSAEETDRLPASAYAPQVTRDVYARLIARCEATLRAGHSVVIDAVHAAPGERRSIEAVADRAGVAFTGLWLEAPPEVLMSRTAARKGDASDATPQVVERQLAYELGPITWNRIAAGDGAHATLAAALSLLNGVEVAP